MRLIIYQNIMVNAKDCMGKNIVKEEVLSKLDHACLNDILKQPSAENISVWVWQRLQKMLQGPNYKLYEVEVWETKTSGCIYRGDL